MNYYFLMFQFVFKPLIVDLMNTNIKDDISSSFVTTEMLIELFSIHPMSYLLPMIEVNLHLQNHVVVSQEEVNW